MKDIINIFDGIMSVSYDFIEFRLSRFTFGRNDYPTETVEIYVNGKDLRGIVEGTAELPVCDLYESLMKVFYPDGKEVPVYGCSCGCIGCSEIDILSIEESVDTVTWNGFRYDPCFDDDDERNKQLKEIRYTFCKEQYYSQVYKVGEWLGERKTLYALGDIFLPGAKEREIERLACFLTDDCTLKIEFKGITVQGKEYVLDYLRNISLWVFSGVGSEGLFYRIGWEELLRDKRKLQEHGYYIERFLELCSHTAPHTVNAYVFIERKSSNNSEIEKILICR